MALSPEDLRDLANLVQNFVNRGGPFHRFHLDLETEAARRDAEAKELGRTQLADGVHHSAEAAGCNPIVEREGPGSADAPFMGVPHTGGVIHKPAPAADDMPKQCDGKEQEAFEAWAKSQGMDMHEHPLHYLFLDKRTGGARDGWSAALRYCRPFFEAQAREIADLKARWSEAFNAAEQYRSERGALKARVARLTEALRTIKATEWRWAGGGSDIKIRTGAGKIARAALAEANDAG
jgi:hypothetical protein